MDARIVRVVILLAAFGALGASHRTPNFLVTASSPELAVEVGNSAETFRHDLAIAWLGHELQPWAQPCPINVQVAPHLGAGGATSFVFHHGEVFDWKMDIQGPHDRLIDSVLPHEVTHTIFATHFRQPLPRWADEGGCTTVEHESERKKQQVMLVQQLKTRRGIPFSDMFAMTEYPADVMPLYSQGFSLARFFIEQGGRRKYVQYIEQGLSTRNWKAATEKFYGFKNLAVLQESWLAWVKEGSPAMTATDALAININPANENGSASGAVELASAQAQQSDGLPEALVYRGQSPGRLASALNRLNPLKKKSRPALDNPFDEVAARGQSPGVAAQQNPGHPQNASPEHAAQAATQNPYGQNAAAMSHQTPAGQQAYPQPGPGPAANPNPSYAANTDQPNVAPQFGAAVPQYPGQRGQVGNGQVNNGQVNNGQVNNGPAGNGAARVAPGPLPGPDPNEWRPSNVQMMPPQSRVAVADARNSNTRNAGAVGAQANASNMRLASASQEVPARNAVASDQADGNSRKVLIEWSRPGTGEAPTGHTARSVGVVDPRLQRTGVYMDAPTSAVEVYRR